MKRSDIHKAKRSLDPATRSVVQTDTIFLRAEYEVRLHRARRACLSSEHSSLFTVVLPLKGKSDWRAKESSGEVQVGGALFIAPAERVTATGDGATLLAVSLQPALLLDCAVRARITRTEAQFDFRARTSERDERLAQLGHSLNDELTEDNAPGRDLSIRAIIEQVIVHLLRRHMTVRRSTDLEVSRVGLVDRRIRRSVELMDAHMERELTLGELAAAAYLSPFHFARLFKKLMGTSPHAYLAALRIQRAQTLLAETDLSVTEVAIRIGYQSSSHFARAFRQTTGLTPRAFRASLVCA